MIHPESLRTSAHAQGRQYVGAADGGDLQVNFKPSWSRTPQLDVIVGDGSFEEKIRGAWDARKARGQQEKVDFVSFGCFQGHALDWGVKMIVTKVNEPANLVAYQLVLVRLAEEIGARTAYYYDLLLRMKLAKELESGMGNAHASLCSLDRDILSDAKQKSNAKPRWLAISEFKVSRALPQPLRVVRLLEKTGVRKASYGTFQSRSSARDAPSRSLHRSEKNGQ